MTDCDQFDVVLERLRRLRLRTQEAGEIIACAYLGGAMGNVRHAREVMRGRWDYQGRPAPRSAVEPYVVWDAGRTVIGMRPVAPGSMVGRRCTLTDKGWGRDEAADLPPVPARPDLGAQLLTVTGIRDAAVRPVFAAMLWQALAYHEWYHLPTASRWSVGRDGALALVRALGDGREVCRLPYELTGGMVDSAVMDLLRGLGWRRFRTAGLRT